MEQEWSKQSVMLVKKEEWSEDDVNTASPTLYPLLARGNEDSLLWAVNYKLIH